MTRLVTGIGIGVLLSAWVVLFVAARWAAQQDARRAMERLARQRRSGTH